MIHPDLIRIDPFNMDTKESPIINSNTLVLEISTSQTPTSPPVSTTTRSSLEILDPPAQTSHEIPTPRPIRQSTRIRKSTQLLDFTYSSFLLYLLYLLFLFTVCLSLHPIERLFVIPIGRML